VSGARLTLADVLLATGGVLVGKHDRAPEGCPLESVSIDSRTVEPGALFVAIRGPRFDGHDFTAAAAARGAAVLLLEREAETAGLPAVRVADTTRALGALARHHRRQSAIPVVAITGSVGKTTTKDMAAQLLATRGPVLKTEGNLNNRYGLPLTLLRLRGEHTAAVVELGMSAPGEIRALSALAEPDVATITKVAPVHLEFFPSVDAIAEAKAEILEGLAARGTAVLNGDDPRLVRIGERFSGRVLWFGSERRFDVSAGPWRAAEGGLRFELRVGGRGVEVALPLAGPHFVADFLAAAAAAHALGIAPEAMAEAARSMRPARHRGEVVRLAEDVVLLDDCYNSSPDALEAAVVALGTLPGRRRVAVLGEMLELGPQGPSLHRERGRALAGRVDVLIGVGPLAKELVEGAREAGLNGGGLHHLASAAEAALAARAIVAAGDAVLVKASRGVQLEAVVEALVDRFGKERA
jgi:UDP-N-acetylmuramoyl-tripeptide--D-alanyl-D-alanine ligase